MILAASMIMRAKLIASINDVHVPGITVSKTLLSRFDYYFQRLTIARLDGIVAVSDSIVSTLAPGRDFLRVEGGISKESERAEPINGDFDGDSTRAFRLVAAGSVDELNGVEEILEALSHIDRKNIEVIIAGAGPLVDHVVRASYKDSRIKYVGFLSFKEVLKLYQTADILLNIRITRRVNTDFFFPSKLMEYLASGTPVISTCTGHVESEFGSICYLLKDETPHGLARLIEQVLDIPRTDRQKVGRDARRFMLDQKTWPRQGQRVAEYIRKVLKSDSHSSSVRTDLNLA